jgi:uncharacterized protein (DUF488 family)
LKILTVGHSNHRLDEFLEMLSTHGVECLIDIRTIPRSRHNPQFNKESLADTLGYVHMPGLGGLRHSKKDSINSGWKNESFRGYADYMQTDEFACNLDELITRAREKQVCIMCAESVPWRCHRSLVADALTARGIEVKHIMNAKSANLHKLTLFALISGFKVIYPAEAE